MNGVFTTDFTLAHQPGDNHRVAAVVLDECLLDQLNDDHPESAPHEARLASGDMTQSDYLDKLTETPDVTDVETGVCSVE